MQSLSRPCAFACDDALRTCEHSATELQQPEKKRSNLLSHSFLYQCHIASMENKRAFSRDSRELRHAYVAR